MVRHAEGMWPDNVSDTGIYVVVVVTLIVVAAGFVASWVWKRDNQRKIARYEAWLDQEERRRRQEEA
jgi:hypothetical protein